MPRGRKKIKIKYEHINEKTNILTYALSKKKKFPCTQMYYFLHLFYIYTQIYCFIHIQILSIDFKSLKKLNFSLLTVIIFKIIKLNNKYLSDCKQKPHLIAVMFIIFFKYFMTIFCTCEYQWILHFWSPFLVRTHGRSDEGFDRE